MANMSAIESTGEGLRELCGRGMSTTSEVYKLPVDKQERERLSSQHTIWKLMMNNNGLYPSDVQSVIDDIFHIAEHPAILDVGSGSGAWAVDMARLYPSSTILGIDLTCSCPDEIPGNCSFITKDATTGLEEYAEKFDIVHTRCVVGHILDPAAAFRIFGKCLKPGGILLAADGNRILFNEKLERLPPANLSLGANNEGCSHVTGWMNELNKRKCVDGIIPVPGEDQPDFVRIDGQFEMLGEKSFYTPMGWDGGEMCAPNGEELSRLWAPNFNRYLHASKGIFLSTGETPETVDKWIADVMGDVPPRLKTLYKFTFFWARKV